MNANRIPVFAGLAILALFAVTSTTIRGADTDVEATMLRILVDPEKFHGKKVRLRGYCTLRYEATAIYLSYEDFNRHLGNSLWLNIDDKDFKPYMKNITFCRVHGTFNRKNRGHMSGYEGTIEKITLYESWPPKPKPIESKTKVPGSH